MFRKNIKPKLAKVAVALIAILLLSGSVYAQPGSVQVRFQIKYLDFDNYNNGFKMHVNVSTSAPGHLTYLEEYYLLQGSYPLFVSSERFDGGDLVKMNNSYNASFDILRPVGSYNLVKSVLLLDGNRVFEYWLSKNHDFIDNTPAADDSENALLSGIRNVDRYEIVEENLNPDTAVVFNYKSLGDIPEVDVLGSGKDDVNLRVELLKGRDSMTANPGIPVYRYFNIKSDSIHIQNISVMYRVDNAWMKNVSISAKNVRMLGWDSAAKIWRVLPTNLIDNDSQYTYYRSVSDTLPYFAVAGQQVKKIAPKVNSTNKTVTAREKNDTVKATPSVGTVPIAKGAPGFGYLVALIALILVYMTNRRK